jgi:hypothetical protein
LPTAVVIASRHAEVADWIQHALAGDGLRAYVTDDVVGVELGGAFKNVIALGAGVCDGAGLGQNARAALITRGLAEIGRLCHALGAHPATLSGLAGLGDLVLTCTGGLSRNRRVGLALGQGQKLRGHPARDGDGRRGHQQHPQRPPPGPARARRDADHGDDARHPVRGHQRPNRGRMRSCSEISSPSATRRPAKTRTVGDPRGP